MPVECVQIARGLPKPLPRDSILGIHRQFLLSHNLDPLIIRAHLPLREHEDYAWHPRHVRFELQAIRFYRLTYLAKSKKMDSPLIPAFSDACFELLSSLE